MTVPKGRRRDAYSKFEQKMIELHKLTSERLKAAPVRYRRIATTRVYELSSEAYSYVLQAGDIRPKDDDKISQRDDLLKMALTDLEGLQAPLWCFWNIARYDERRMTYWSGLINEEMVIIAKVARLKEAPMLIRTIPWNSVNEALFLKNMAELHRFSYQKIAHTPKRYYEYVSAEIIRCVDAAWCGVLLGDSVRPETKADVKRREKHFAKAKANLNSMQRPLYALWNVEEYSENEMDEWAKKIDLELRLLSGVIKSDAERYRDITE